VKSITELKAQGWTVCDYGNMDMKTASDKSLRVQDEYAVYDYESIFDGKEVHHVHN